MRKRFHINETISQSLYILILIMGCFQSSETFLLKQVFQQVILENVKTFYNFINLELQPVLWR